MKVLFVSSGNSPFGISPIIKSQGESLRRKGLDINYYTVKGKGIKGYLQNIPMIRKEIKRNQYDIIHAHYGDCGIICSFARKKERLIVSFMGDDLLGSNNSDGSINNSSKFFISINNYFANNKYDYCIVKSKQMLNGINHSNVAMIPNGVDFSTFFPVAKNISREKLNIQFYQKLIIFVTDKYRKEKNFTLAKETVDLLKDERIMFKSIHGISQQELNFYYNAADVLLLTSFHEGSPNVIKEAMTCNCPIVSTDVGDVKWLIGNTLGCYLTSYKPQDIAEKIKLALEFGDTIGRTNGRERIIYLGLDSKTISEEIINIYKKVL